MADGRHDTGSAAKGQDTIDAVYLVVGGEAEVRVVETGVADVLDVEITSGLEEGDEVVIGPYRTLKDLKAGDRVRSETKNDRGNEDGDEESGAVEVRVE